MSTSTFRRRGTAVLALLLVVFGVGVAAAAWVQTGTGVGEARATTAVASTIVAGTPVADLYPGKTGGNVIFTVNNPNDYAVNFTSLAAGTVTNTSNPACAASNVTLNGPVTVDIDVPANSTSAAVTVPGVTNMISNADNACQGVTFEVALTLTGASS